MIGAGNILGELSERRPRPLFSGDENMLGREREEGREEEGRSQGGEERGEERVGLGLGSHPHTWDQSNSDFYHQNLWSNVLCQMQTSLALHR